MTPTLIQPRALPEAFRRVALAVAVVGAAGSVTFLLRAGNRNSALILLVVMFAIWVASPFIALAWAIGKASRWQAPTRSALYWLTIVLAAASLAIYSRVIDLKPAGSPNTFLFVAVPPVSWAVIAIIMTIAYLASRRQA